MFSSYSSIISKLMDQAIASHKCPEAQEELTDLIHLESTGLEVRTVERSTSESSAADRKTDLEEVLDSLDIHSKEKMASADSAKKKDIGYRSAL